ncbi:MAG TPA: hypothetical protein PKM99_05460 [Thermotogota bacterium]|nr:hypothetical protein [Thermotogota bacterium]NLZ14437.1 hypothetical protein [Thermotogaceae bacterium]MDD8040955.1 hypothetical protein [Thermotogota bacterium]MDD8053066.1 hypothetical protein [Thermotogota bacterium]HNR63257.1 hypothetical protein [Thermotogota bacterium]
MLVEVLSGLWIAAMLVCMLLCQQGFILDQAQKKNLELIHVSDGRQMLSLFEGDFFTRCVSPVYCCQNKENTAYEIAFWERTQGVEKFVIYLFQTRKNHQVYYARRCVIDLDNLPNGLSEEYLSDLIAKIESGTYKIPDLRIYHTNLTSLCQGATLKRKGQLLHYQDFETSFYF